VRRRPPLHTTNVCLKRLNLINFGRPTSRAALDANHERAFSRSSTDARPALNRFNSFTGGTGPQVRSSFFTPASLRGVSPAVRKLNHFGSGQGSTSALGHGGH